MPHEFAAKLRRLIDERDVSDATVARAVKVAPSALVRWTRPESEHGPGQSVRRPTARQMLELARYLGVAVEYLIDDDIEVPPVPPSERDKTILAIVRVRERIEGLDVITLEEIAWRLSGPVERPKGEASRRLSEERDQSGTPEQ